MYVLILYFNVHMSVLMTGIEKCLYICFSIVKFIDFPIDNACVVVKFDLVHRSNAKVDAIIISYVRIICMYIRMYVITYIRMYVITLFTYVHTYVHTHIMHTYVMH